MPMENIEDFYIFRSKIRKKLGRIIFYPCDIEFYVDDIIKIITKQEEIAKIYIKGCTKNEKEVLCRISEYLENTRGDSDFKRIMHQE